VAIEIEKNCSKIPGRVSGENFWIPTNREPIIWLILRWANHFCLTGGNMHHQNGIEKGANAKTEKSFVQRSFINPSSTCKVY
jgi:hypothetical protein